jgi:hypothetical protein
MILQLNMDYQMRLVCAYGNSAMEKSIFISPCQSRSGDPVLSLSAEAYDTHRWTVCSKAKRFHYHVLRVMLEMNSGEKS